MAKPSSILINIHTPRFDPIVRDAEKQLGLRRQESETRTAEKLVEAKRLVEGEKRGTNVRAGRGDTGFQVFGPEGLHNAELSELVVRLLALGYKPVYAGYRQTPVRDKSDGELITRPTGKGEFKYVVRVVFSREADADPIGDGFSEKLVAFLKGKVFRHAHVWENDHSHTVNTAGGIDPNCGTFRQLTIDEHGNYAETLVKKERPSPAPTA